MELHPLPGRPDLGLVRQHAEVRSVTSRQLRTISQILDDARRQMEEDDRYSAAYDAWLTGKPVPQLRHPRRSLRQWLTGQRQQPPPAPPPMTETVPVWRGAAG